MTYTIRTTLAPTTDVVVSDREYANLLAQGLIYSATPGGVENNSALAADFFSGNKRFSGDIRFDGDVEAYTAPVIRGVPNTPEMDQLPIGSTAKARNTGLNILSSFAGGEDDASGGTYDSTGRINFYSYQRAQTGSFGEVQRLGAMRRDSKQMIAWYAWVNPDRSPGYDPTTRDPMPGASWKPIAWCGAHVEANDHLSMHNHWSIEAPDTTGALQTRFEMLIGDRTTGLIGLDKTFLITNQADLVVRCSNGQTLRIAGSAGVEKAITFANDTFDADTTSRRWKLRATSEAESTGNLGTNFQLVRYNDSGVVVDTPFISTRSNGLITIGGTSGTSSGLAVSSRAAFGNTAVVSNARAHITSDGTDYGLYINTTAAGTASFGMLFLNAPDTTKRGIDFRVNGDNVSRLRTDMSLGSGSGTITFGNGTLADTSIYRQTTNILGLSGGMFLSGIGAPGTPTGGGYLYVDASGNLNFKTSAGNVRQVAAV